MESRLSMGAKTNNRLDFGTFRLQIILHRWQYRIIRIQKSNGCRTVFRLRCDKLGKYFAMVLLTQLNLHVHTLVKNVSIGDVEHFRLLSDKGP